MQAIPRFRIATSILPTIIVMICISVSYLQPVVLSEHKVSTKASLVPLCFTPAQTDYHECPVQPFTATVHISVLQDGGLQLVEASWAAIIRNLNQTSPSFTSRLVSAHARYARENRQDSDQHLIYLIHIIDSHRQIAQGEPLISNLTALYQSNRARYHQIGSQPMETLKSRELTESLRNEVRGGWEGHRLLGLHDVKQDWNRWTEAEKNLI